ncbi:MAG: hypothetical protein HAW67_05770, partial [Endozoicomonadaceae bacterium]|nr:hypothetical protein [Endozoicomonadaceae bacterium]
MPSTKVMTVVFNYQQGSELASRFTRSLHDKTPFNGVEVIAVSLEDEIKRVEHFEDKSQHHTELPSKTPNDVVLWVRKV